MLREKHHYFVVAVLLTLVCMAFHFAGDSFVSKLLVVVTVVYLTSIHKALGFAALVVAIVVHQHCFGHRVHSYNYYTDDKYAAFEGFKTISDIVPADKATDKDSVKATVTAPASAQAKAPAPVPAPVKAQAKAPTQAPAQVTAEATEKASAQVPNKAKEGFCMIDRESSMLRGKTSNTLPVQNRTQSDHVEPTDMSVFSGYFSAFSP